MRSNYSTGYGNIANQRSRDFNDTMIATEDKFEEIYISLRKKEGRCYTDKELVELPDISASHLHYKEWQVRRRSCRRLIEYLSDMNKPLNILEVGCGNGWLSHRLSGIHGSRVFATDVCTTEINQAARIFKEIKNLKFIQGNWKHVRLDQSEFDIIIFAASVQYFSSLTDLGTEVKEFLSKKGEIHFIDSKFYLPEELESARNRTKDYYISLGHPEMSLYYFHHTLTELQQFQYRILYDPLSIGNKLFNRNDPFLWIRIRK